MARLSKVSLSHINIPGNHSFAFANNAARDAWYDGRSPTNYENLMYNRESGIYLDGVLDEFRTFNFGYYINEVGDRIYFRVVTMSYINENNTLIQIEKDVLMTYLPTSVMKPSFIERSNDAPSSIFDSDVPEVEYHGGNTHTLLDTFVSDNNYLFFIQVSGDAPPEAQKIAMTTYIPQNFSGDTIEAVKFSSMFQFFTLPGPSDWFALALIEYATHGTGDRIVSAGCLPAADVGYDEFIDDDSMVSHVEGVRLTKTVSVGTSLNARIAKDNVTVVIAERDNFANQIEIPISELSGGSLQLVSVSDPITQQRHYAVLSGADGDNELKYRLTINTGASLPSMNLPYYMATRNIETDLSAQQMNNLIGGSTSAVNGAISGAAGGALLGPAGMAAGAAVGAAGAGLATATNAIQLQNTANASLEKAKRMTPSVSGTPSGFGVFANRSIGVNIFIKEPSGSGLQQMIDYYRFFGYHKSRIITPNVKSGTRFYQGNVNGNFPGASATDTSIIRSLFETGVWIWTNEAGEFSY